MSESAKRSRDEQFDAGGLAKRQRQAQSEVSIDRWAITQGHAAASSLVIAIKKALQHDASGGSQSLDLSWNELTVCPPGLAEVPALVELDLRLNRLTSIPAEVADANLLVRLDLRMNRLADLPGDLVQFKVLRHLDLRDNAFLQIPRFLLELPYETVIKLEQNPFSEEENIAFRRCIARRRAAGHSVPEIILPPLVNSEAAIDQWGREHRTFKDGELKVCKDHVNRTSAPYLTNLDFCKRELKSFPAEMSNALFLKELKLRSNAITSFPPEMSHAFNLEKLDLDHNKLSAFPKEMANAPSLQRLCLNRNKLTSFPKEMGNACNLEHLFLNQNLLTSFPAEMGNAQALKRLNLTDNQLTSIPAEIGNLSSLQWLHLKKNRLTSIPDELGNLSALRELCLNENNLTSVPAGIGNARKLRTLDLRANNLSGLPDELMQLRDLRHLHLQGNLFTQVPRILLEMPAETEIDLRNNPLPEAEIRAILDFIFQRRAAGLTVPSLLLPALAENAGELRDAVADNMNVHSTVLTTAFKKRLDEVVLQFPDHLKGTTAAQQTEMRDIASRLKQKIAAYAQHHPQESSMLSKAQNVANLMFRKGQGETGAYYNEFRYSAGHVLSYSFLSIEAQWRRTPVEHRQEAEKNGMAALINALQNGTGFCDTRLCEEVMQTIGLPYSDYAEAHLEIVQIRAPGVSREESHDVLFALAKATLRTMLDQGLVVAADAPTAAWREALLKAMQKDHPNVPAEHVQQHLAEIESTWETFYELVVEQGGD